MNKKIIISNNLGQSKHIIIIVAMLYDLLDIKDRLLSTTDS